MYEKSLKWADIEADVFNYVTSHGVKLTLEQFRYPRGGTSGRKYIGPHWRKLEKLDPRWVPSTTDDPMDYDDTLWRGVRAWETYCKFISCKAEDGKSCADFCNERLARN